MKKSIHFQLATADGSVCDENVSYVNAPVEGGSVGILANHAPLVASLTEGVIKYTVSGQDCYAAVSGGVMSMADNELIILARSAEKAESIDLARAQASESRARERIASKSSEWDMKRAELSLMRSLARQKAYHFLHQ